MFASKFNFIFSFFVRSNVTGTFAVGLYQQDGGKINSGNYTINSADTWEKKTNLD